MAFGFRALPQAPDVESDIDASPLLCSKCVKGKSIRNRMGHSQLWRASALSLAVASSGALASEIQTFTYDARGRLMIVRTSGTVNNGQARSYCYDRADNRQTFKLDSAGALATCVATPTPSPTPSPTPTPTPTNTPPVANSDTKSVNCQQITSANVTGNDTDVDGDYPLTLTSVVLTSGTTNGISLTVESASSVGVEAFQSGQYIATYTIRDSRNATDTGTLTINVSGSLCDFLAVSASEEAAKAEGAGTTQIDAATDPPSEE